MSADTSPAIELRGASKIFRTPSGGSAHGRRDLDLTIGRGEFVAVVGPTGCGKSTTLTLVSGLEEPTEGEVLVAGEPVAGIGDKVGFVFQQDAIFPWRTVLSNVMAGPRFRGVPKARGEAAGPRMAGPGRAVRLRGPLPAPALRRPAQARRARRDLRQRPRDPARWTSRSRRSTCRPGP